MNQAAHTTAGPVSFNPWELGQLIAEQGGIYAGIVRGESGDYHLFVAPEDASADDITWGEYGKAVKGADSVNDGIANTQALIAAGGCPAAEACNAYRGNGFDDWYLPAQAELSVCFANARENFQKRWYWSSTQSSEFYAWLQNFSHGNQGYGPKASLYRVRAVRRLSVL